MAYRWRTPAEIAAAGGTKRWSAFALSAVAGYPAVADVADGVWYGTTGTEFEGTLAAVNADFTTVAGGGHYVEAVAAEVLDSVSFGAHSALTGTVHLPLVGEVTSNAVFGPASALTGTYHRPETNEVIDTATFGIVSGQTGTIHQPLAAEVIDTGRVEVFPKLDVISTATFGPGSVTSGTVILPAEGEVVSGIFFGPVGGLVGESVLPLQIDVRNGIIYGDIHAVTVGLCHVPIPDVVIAPVDVDAVIGTYHAPDAAEVADTAVYGPNSLLVGTLAVTGIVPDVRPRNP